MRAEVCDFSLDWTPGTGCSTTRRAAHLTQAMVIEAVTGQDYRAVIRDKVLAPLGLTNDIYVGLPASEQERCADTYRPSRATNSAEFKAARNAERRWLRHRPRVAAFYQMLLGAAGSARCGCCRAADRLCHAAAHGERGDDAMGGIRCTAGWAPCARESEKIRASARSARTRPSAWAAPGPRILGRIRRAGCRSLHHHFMRPIRGIPHASTGWPTSSTPRSIDHAQADGAARRSCSFR